MKIEFYGAARTVTGSCHMLNFAGGKLLVDCGMRQGADAKGAYGEGTFPFDPKEIDAVLLTHAHIDHSGLLPLLTKQGFSGKILCTEATAQLATILLPDSAHIQQQDAEWQTRKNLRAGKPPVEPLYTLEDAQNALKLFHGVHYMETIQLLPDIQVRLMDAGHLLGSAAVEVWVREEGKSTKVVFSGDVGRGDRPIIRDPQHIGEADYLVLESTYGNRNHPLTTNADKEEELAGVIRTALARGGNLVIPSFAVGRTQELLYYIKRLLQKNILPELQGVPVYIDSPLGINATKIYERCAEGYYDEEAAEMAKDGSPFDFPTLHVAQTADESKLINDTKGRKIIISSSGMCDAGRIRHHLKHNLYRADSTILFAGYQAMGTLGRTLIDGAQKVRLFGEDVRVNAAIVQIEGFSGHAGKDELVSWVENMSPRPRRIFLVHGEEAALQSLAEALRERHYDIAIPNLGEGFALAAEGSEKTFAARPDAQDISTKAYGYQAREEIRRMEDLLTTAEKRRSPDMALKMKILEADLKALADKWDALL
ncbi:MBL fold metallo-hydrolase [Christensenellaceae bacterium OttesenSCG-928-L17]|nr:MBL fold metallo-hydrolase [Christensenellaceae bacterium OttesenSCG-928-L17]